VTACVVRSCRRGNVSSPHVSSGKLAQETRSIDRLNCRLTSGVQDEPIEDDPRSDSLAPTSQYAPSTINAYPQHHQDTSSIAHHEHDPPTAPISELADEDTMPTETFPDGTPVRNSTLKKKASVKRGVSVASSRRSVRMPPAKRNDLGPDFWNALNIPIPTTGNPTEVLANRFQG